MALQEHFGHASSEAKVAVNLEWRVSVEEIGVEPAADINCHIVLGGGDREKQLSDESKGALAIAESRMEVDFPRKRPTGSFISSQFKCAPSSSHKRRIFAGNLGSGMESVEVRNVTMVVGRIIDVVEPFLKQVRGRGL